MEVHIRIYVKFRINLGFAKKTLAEFDETYKVSLGAGLNFQQVHGEMPATARKLLDRNGVRVWVWE